MSLAVRTLLFFLAAALSNHVFSATVTDVADPGAYATPSAAQQMSMEAYFASNPFVVPGSIVTTLRGTPTNQANPGLDAPAPPPIHQAQNTEGGVMALPTLSRSCPASTPVTIIVSGYTAEMTARTFPGIAGFGVGNVFIDSRNPDFSEPVTAALTTGSGGMTVGAPVALPEVSFDATVADLPFYFLAVGFDVSESFDPGTGFVTPQASIEIADTPSITLRYDDAGCEPVAAPVPTVGVLQLILLTLLLAGLGFYQVRSSVIG